MKEFYSPCDHCSATFVAESSMRGALMNCPVCGKATRIPGSRDTGWAVIKVAALAGMTAIALLVGIQFGLAAGCYTALGLALLAFGLAQLL